MNNRHRMIVRARKRYGLYPYVRVKFNVDDEFSSALHEALMRLSAGLRDLMISANEAVKAFDWSGISKLIGEVKIDE